MLLSSEGFEAGDLIETNGVEGIVKEITLNHLKLEDFDGSFTYIPNKNAFNSSVARYTHKPIKKEKKLEISEVIRKFGKIVIGEEKLTRYIKVVELLVTVDTDKIDEILEPIFKKYEKVFGIKPYYYANYTVSGVTNRLSITLQILTESPTLILKYKDPLLKEMLFSIYEQEINLGWNDKNKHTQSSLEVE
jgi:small-conductance mechanosensitive channel